MRPLPVPYLTATGSLTVELTMKDPSEHSGEFVIESETSLQTEGSTVLAMGPRSLTPTLDLVMLLSPVSGNSADVAPFLHAIEMQVEPPFGVVLVHEPGDEATQSIVTEFAKTRPWLDLLLNTAAPGRAGALRTGFRAIGHGPVVVMSIDGTDNPLDIGRMRRLYAEGHLIVGATRETQAAREQGRHGISERLEHLSNRTLRWLGRMPLEDPLNGFRLYDAPVVNALQIESQREVDVPLELAAKALAAGLSIVEVPATWTPETSTRVSAAGMIRGWMRWWRWCRRARRRPAVPQFSSSASGLRRVLSSPADPSVTPSDD